MMRQQRFMFIFVLYLILISMIFQGCRSSISGDSDIWTPEKTNIPIEKTPVLTTTSTHPSQVISPTLSTTSTVTPNYTLTPIIAEATLTNDLQLSTTSMPVEDAPPGWIVFLRIGHYPESIDIIHTSGKGWQKVTDHVSYINSPSWSPSGQWIAFIGGKRSGNIYIIHPDGEDLQQLTYSPGYVNNFSWSNDGMFIVYSQARTDRGFLEMDLNLINIKTGQIRQLTNTREILEDKPVISSHGDSIAYVSMETNARKNERHLMMVDIDGTNVRQIMDMPIGRSSISWSPDGKEIIFSSDEECENLYIIELDNREVRQLTDIRGMVGEPTWLVDSEWISFLATDRCHIVPNWNGIYMIRPDGTGLKKVMLIDQYWKSISWNLQIGIKVRNTYAVTEEGNQSSIYEVPTTKDPAIKKLKTGEQLLVLDGPIEAEGYLWWHVRLLDSEKEGWVAEVPGWFVNVK